MIEAISYESVNGLKFGASPEEAIRIFGKPESMDQKTNETVLYYSVTKPNDYDYIVYFDSNKGFTDFALVPQTKATINGVEIKWTLKEILDVIYLDSDPRMDDDGIILYDLGMYIYAFDSSDDDDYSDKTIDFFAKGTMDEWKDKTRPFDIDEIKKYIKERGLDINL